MIAAALFVAAGMCFGFAIGHVYTVWWVNRHD